MINLIIKSIKQLLKSPVKVVMFFCVLVFSTMLLLMGGNLQRTVIRETRTIESTFSTLGTVQQKGAEYYPRTQLWSTGGLMYGTEVFGDAGYVDSFFPAIDPLSPQEQESLLTPDVLQFEGAEYELAPEKRPFYGVTSPNLEEDFPFYPHVGYCIVEFIPYETTVPNVPTLVKVSELISGQNISGDIYICDHYNKNPTALKAGQKYVAYMDSTPWLYDHPDVDELKSEERIYEYSIAPFPNHNSPYSSGIYYGEVTDGYYDTPEGKSWLELAEALEQKNYRFTAVPTDGLELLPSFHADKTPVHMGREITKEEFEAGENVCLLSSKFMRSQNWDIGDTITLQFYYADYRLSADTEYNNRITNIGRINMLNDNCEAFDVFWEADYKIVGAFNVMAIDSEPQGTTDFAWHSAIIPAKSVRASDAENISEVGPMLANTTSFTIPNGTEEEYLENFYAKVPEADELEIVIDDGGYSQIIEYLENMEMKALLLMLIGILAVFISVFLLLYFFIVKQKKRTAIERCLGMTKRQCRISMLSGVLVLCLAAFLTGLLLSSVMFSPEDDLAAESDYYFSTEYSTWEREETPELAQEGSTEFSFALSLGMLLALFVIVAALSLFLVNQSLKTDPVYLIGKE